MLLKPIESAARTMSIALGATADGERKIEEAAAHTQAKILAEIARVESNPYMGPVHRAAIIEQLKAQCK